MKHPRRRRIIISSNTFSKYDVLNKKFEYLKLFIYFAFQSTFNMEKKQSMEVLKDIRSIMEKSSKFLSLSGLSGIFVGVFALFCGAIALYVIKTNISIYNENSIHSSTHSFSSIDFKLLSIAILTLVISILGAFYFTYKKSKKLSYKIWNNTSKRVLASLSIPLITGGIVCLYLWTHAYYELLAPLSLIFYGVSLLNSSKYLLPEIKWLGNSEIFLGLINLLWPGYGIYFWMTGFGLLHLIYGIAMWNKYDRIINK